MLSEGREAQLGKKEERVTVTPPKAKLPRAKTITRESEGQEGGPSITPLGTTAIKEAEWEKYHERKLMVLRFQSLEVLWRWFVPKSQG